MLSTSDWYEDILGQFEDLSEFFPDYENLFDFDKKDKGRNNSWNDDKDFKWEDENDNWNERKGGNAWGKLKSDWWKNFEWGQSFNWNPGKSGWKNHGKGNDKIPNGHVWGRHFNTDWIFNMPKWEETFSYDSSGNLTEKANFWGKIDYEYNTENQMLKAGGRTYEYDKNGNLTSEQMNSMTTNYAYNESNRVVEVLHQTPGFNRKEHWKTPNGVAYTYDALGRRNSRKVISELVNGKHREQFGKKENRTSTLYDGLSFNILAESEDRKRSGRNNGWSSSSNRSFNPVTEYVNVNGKILVSTSSKNSNKNLLDSNRNNSLDKTYFSHDILGSVILKTSEKGNRIMSHEYDAYGNMIEGRIAGATQLGYNEKEMDLMTGWYDYGFRDYSPLTMRFTTVDPIRDGKNWYGFVGGDPVNRIDLFGLASEDDNNLIGYETLDEAGIAAIDNINQQSIDENVEYGGNLYYDESFGKYFYTEPIRGYFDSHPVKPYNIPRKTKLVGDYHTHGNYSKTGYGEETGVIFVTDKKGDQFSSEEITSTDIRCSEDILYNVKKDGSTYTAYVGTPSNRVLVLFTVRVKLKFPNFQYELRDENGTVIFMPML